MPSGYIKPRVHINPPKRQRPNLLVRFRAWWKATDLDAKLAESVDPTRRRKPSSR
jgi:hypothetical protein